MTGPSAVRLHKVLAGAGQDFTARLASGQTLNRSAWGTAADGRYPPGAARAGRWAESQLIRRCPRRGS
jgi:hypothetical protein